MSDDAAIVELEMTEEKRHKSSSPSGIKSFFAGGIGGVWCIATGHPLDTIKVHIKRRRRIRSCHAMSALVIE